MDARRSGVRGIRLSASISFSSTPTGSSNSSRSAGMKSSNREAPIAMPRFRRRIDVCSPPFRCRRQLDLRTSSDRAARRRPARASGRLCPFTSQLQRTRGGRRDAATAAPRAPRTSAGLRGRRQMDHDFAGRSFLQRRDRHQLGRDDARRFLVFLELAPHEQHRIVR